jgi:hypothetical protein
MPPTARRSPRPFGRPIDQLDLDLGNFREGQYGVARPIETRHHAAIEGELLLQRAAHSLNDTPLDLCLDAVRIDDLSAIVNNTDLGDANLAGGAIDLDLGNSPDIGSRQFVFDVAAAPAPDDVAVDGPLRRGTRLPFRQSRQTVEHFEAALIGGIGMPHAEFEWIRIRRGRYLVEEAFILNP